MSVYENIIQLRETLFTEAILRKIPRLDVVIIGEGKNDIEVVKKIHRKLLGETKKSDNVFIAYTDVEGVNNIPLMINMILSLVKSSRGNLKSVVTIIDADTYSVDERVQSLVDSLRSRSEAGDLKIYFKDPLRDEKCSQVFIVETILRMKKGDRKMYLIIGVNGDFTRSFKRRCLEDHCIKLMNIIIDKEIECSKQLVPNIENCLSHIDKENIGKICEAFDHICRIFQILFEKLN